MKSWPGKQLKIIELTKAENCNVGLAGIIFWALNIFNRRINEIGIKIFSAYFFIIHLKPMLMNLLQEVRLFLGFMHHVLDITNRYELLQKAISELLKVMSVEDVNGAAREHLSPVVLEKMCEMIAVMPVDLQTNVEVNQVLFRELAENPAITNELAERVLLRIAADVIFNMDDQAFLNCGREAVKQLLPVYPQAVQIFAAELKNLAEKAGSPSDGLLDLISFFRRTGLK